MTTAPMANTPVRFTHLIPRWLIDRAQLSIRYLCDIDEHAPAELFSDCHTGETITTNGRRALVCEPDGRGKIIYLETAAALATLLKVDWGVSLPTWRGGPDAMRFCFVAPDAVDVPRRLQRFVEIHSIAAEIARRFISRIQPDMDQAAISAAFWNPFWSALPTTTADERSDVSVSVHSLIHWHLQRLATEVHA